MTDSNKNLLALINGIIRRDYYDDETITDDLLKQELFPAQSCDGFAALVNKIRSIIKSMASSNMDHTQADTFLTSQTKKREGGVTEQQSKLVMQCWKVHRTRIHDSIVRHCVCNNRLRDMSWRIDVKSRSRHTDQISTPAAIVELHLANTGAIQQGVEVVRFEMDESGLGKVLNSLKNIGEQIDKHAKLESSK
jgi:uncharacterized protein YbaA (DUF1428 family)